MDFLRNLFRKEESLALDERGTARTKNPKSAVNLLLGVALDTTPSISESDLRNEYKSLQNAWASRELFSGDTVEMKKIILSNLKGYASKSQFNYFEIAVLSDKQCAQVNAIFSNSFTGIRVWRMNQAIYVCGNSAFHA